MEKSFREQFKRHQETLIEEGFFDGTVGGVFLEETRILIFL